MIDNLEKDKFEKPNKLLDNLATGTIRYIYEYLIKEQLHPVEFNLFTLTVCKEIYCATLEKYLLLTENEKMMLTEHFEHNHEDRLIKEVKERKELVLSIHKKILESIKEATEKTIKKNEDIENRQTKYVVDKE